MRADASLDRDVRIQLEDRVELPRLYMAWLSPAMFAEGDADLDLAADMLANGKTSRLYRRLVFEERIATDVSASQNSREIGGYLQLAATAAPGHTLGELERAILEEIGRLGAGGPTDDEIERGRVQAEAQFVFRLQTVGGFGGKSDQLNAYNVFLRRPVVLRPRSAALLRGHGRSLQQTVAPLSRSGSTGDAQHRAARPQRARRARLGARGRLVSDRPLAAARTGAVRPRQFSRHRKVDAAERPDACGRFATRRFRSWRSRCSFGAARRAIRPGSTAWPR